MLKKQKDKWVADFKEGYYEDDEGFEPDSIETIADIINLADANFKKYCYSCTIEFSVIKSSNKQGLDSWGYQGPDKIILFDLGLANISKKKLQWLVDVTNAVTATMNTHKL